MSEYARHISIGSNNYLVIDLTQPLGLDQKGYPGDSRPGRRILSDIQHDGWHHYSHDIADHTFHPHCDAPNHFQPDRQSEGMEIYGLEWAFHKACLIDLSNSADIEVHEGIRYLREINVCHLRSFSQWLQDAEAIVIRTGYDRFIEANILHQPGTMPYLTADAALFLAGFENIRVTGIDSLTVDAYGKQTSHMALKRMMIVESLVHLYEIPQEAHIRFTLQTSALRIEGATGGPVIAYAFIEI